MSGLTELLARVEAATGPDRELDRDIGFELAGWKLVEVATPNPRMMLEIDGDIYPDHPGAMYVSFTESVDEALALVDRLLPEFGVQVGHPLKKLRGWGWYASVFRERLPGETGWWPGHYAGGYDDTDGHLLRYYPSAPLAVLAALLKALIANA